MRLARQLVDLRPDPGPVDGPTVSIVVTNRDGKVHLRRLLAGLEKRTRYAAIELVLVDNGSSDGSVKLVDRWPGPLKLVANEENQSFSAANNQGVRAATGELVLLANNDIDPIHPDWLGYMVESLQDDVAAVGALLVYPRRRKRRGAVPQHADLTVQHRGASFDTSQWGVRAVNAGAGEDPLAIDPPRRRDVPMATAACLLARRADLLAHPLDESYWYGSEDWDACLRLSSRGRIVVDERAVLFHHEFGTQDKYRDQAWLDRRTRNHQWFNDLWGPALLRQRRLEVTGSRADWFYRGEDAPTVHVADGGGRHGALAASLTVAMEQAGWEVITGKPRKCDLAIALGPPANVPWFLQQELSVAVVLDREADWVSDGATDAAHLVVAPNEVVAGRLATAWGTDLTAVLPDLGHDAPAAFAEILRRCRPDEGGMRIGVSTCAPDWERARFWGDTYLARGLTRAFRRLGHDATELIQPDWRSRAASSCDVVVHLRGVHRRPVARGQWNLLWIISHPDRLEPGECDDYDVVATASRSHAEHLSQELGRTVHFMPQATDADTFASARYTTDHADSILYVGVARHPHRLGPRWLMRSGRPFQLYGRHWEDHPEASFAMGAHLDNRDLPNAYHSAAVVVADHHGSMRTQGFLANRLFDVLAAGGVVLSDDVRGVDELFGDLVPTYANPTEMDGWLDTLLTDPTRRRHLAAAGREFVLAGHTLDHRARQWLDILDELPTPAG